MGSRLLTRAVAGLAVVVVLLVAARRAPAVSPADAILPLDQYTTDKGRALAAKYEQELRTLSAGIYNCLPWVAVEKHSISFQRPKHLLPADARYLSVRIFVEQDPSPSFARLPVQDRAAAMYSRYVGPLLKRMGRSQALVADPALDGFGIILDWLKQSAQPAGDRPIYETIAVFIDKAAAVSYLDGKATPRELADHANILAWDGETPLGRLRVTKVAHDDFVATYQIKNYQPDPGVTCP